MLIAVDVASMFTAMVIQVQSVLNRNIWSGPFGLARLGPGPDWAQGPFGPRAHLGPGPVWAHGPFGPRAHLDPGPVWAQGPFGPRALLGLGHIWAPGVGAQGPWAQLGQAHLDQPMERRARGASFMILSSLRAFLRGP